MTTSTSDHLNSISTMSQSDEICPFCDQTISADRSEITERGLPKILELSRERKDGILERLKPENTPIPVHMHCRRPYTRPNYVRKRKNANVWPGGDAIECDSKVICRSEVSSFNIKSDCVFCAKYIDTVRESKLNKERRDKSHNVETIEVLHSIKEKALKRDDNWGHEVLTRVQNFSDLVAAGAAYHHSCHIRFMKVRGPKSEYSKGRPIGTTDDAKTQSFKKLIDYINEGDVKQFTISDLKAMLLHNCSSGDECYQTKTLKL